MLIDRCAEDIIHFCYLFLDRLLTNVTVKQGNKFRTWFYTVSFSYKIIGIIREQFQITLFIQQYKMIAKYNMRGALAEQFHTHCKTAAIPKDEDSLPFN